MLHILLPICIDFQEDVFFSILKNVVTHVKLTDNYHEKAFKSGLIAEEIHIDENVLLHWNKLTSREDRIQQSKLLGFWAATNCPNYGNVLHGRIWEAPLCNYIKVLSKTGQKLMNNAEIDAAIIPKMKCIVVELNNLSQSTSQKLQKFVKVPINEIKVNNERQISKKIKTFDVDNEYIERCWMALKSGEWKAGNGVRQFFLYI